MKRIPLSPNSSRGVRAYALVDDEDYASLTAKGVWTLQLGRSGLRYAGRLERRDDGRRGVLMHRLLMGLDFGDPRVVDHVDHDGINNQRSNLRICTAAENLQNRRPRGGVSRFRGVSWNASLGRWIATARADKRCKSLGYFDDELEAALAAQAWRDEHMPFALPDVALAEVLQERAA